MDVSIIIVNWNSLDYVRECIASINENTTAITHEVIIVDNGSTDGDFDQLQQSFPHSIIVRSRKNLGFARANNLGFQHATGEYLLFLNPDTKLMGPAINTMLTQIRVLPDAGVVGCKLLNSDLSVQLTSIQPLPTIMNQVLDAEALLLRWPNCPFWQIDALFKNNVQPVRVDAISGACMLLSRAVFERAGMFSEDYFMYAEDLDLNYKVKRLGLSNYYLDQAVIIHYGGKSSSQRKESQWATVMKHKSMLRLFRNMGGRPYEWIYRAAMGATATARLLILAILFPFGKKESIRNSAAKWKTILRLTFGSYHSPVESNAIPE